MGEKYTKMEIPRTIRKTNRVARLEKVACAEKAEKLAAKAKRVAAALERKRQLRMQRLKPQHKERRKRVRLPRFQNTHLIFKNPGGYDRKLSNIWLGFRRCKNKHRRFEKGPFGKKNKTIKNSGYKGFLNSLKGIKVDVVDKWSSSNC